MKSLICLLFAALITALEIVASFWAELMDWNSKRERLLEGALEFAFLVLMFTSLRFWMRSIFGGFEADWISKLDLSKGQRLPDEKFKEMGTSIDITNGQS